MVSGHGHVVAHLVHDVHQIRPFGERANGLALHGVARVHERDVARTERGLGLLLDRREARVADARGVALLVEGLVHAAVHVVGVQDGEGALGCLHGVGLQRGVVEPEIIARALSAHVVKGEVVPVVDAGGLVGVVALAGRALRVCDVVRAVVALGGYLVRPIGKTDGGHDRERVAGLHLECRIAQLEGAIPGVVQGLGRAPHGLAACGVEPSRLGDDGGGVLVHGQVDRAAGLVHEGAHRAHRFKAARFEHVGELHGRAAVPPSVAPARAVVLVDAVVDVLGALGGIRRILRHVGREVAQGGVVVGEVEVASVAPVLAPAVLDDPRAVAFGGILGEDERRIGGEGGVGRRELLLLEGVVPADDGHLMVRHLRGRFVRVVLVRAIVGALLVVPVEARLVSLAGGAVRRIHGSALHEGGLDGVYGGCIARVVVAVVGLVVGEDVDLRQVVHVLGPHVRARAQAVVDASHACLCLMRGGRLVDGAVPAHERGRRLVPRAALRVGVVAVAGDEGIAGRPQARVVVAVRAVVRKPGKMAFGKVDVGGLSRFEQVRLKRRQRAERPAVAVDSLVLHARDERGAVHVAQVEPLRQRGERRDARARVVRRAVERHELRAPLGLHHGAGRVLRGCGGFRMGYERHERTGEREGKGRSPDAAKAGEQAFRRRDHGHSFPKGERCPYPTRQTRLKEGRAGGSARMRATSFPAPRPRHRPGPPAAFASVAARPPPGRPPRSRAG